MWPFACAAQDGPDTAVDSVIGRIRPAAPADYLKAPAWEIRPAAGGSGGGREAGGDGLSMYSPDGQVTAAGARQLPPDRRFALKAATDAAHTRVEDVIRTAGLFDSIAGFRRYLAATWTLRIRLERQLDVSGAGELWPLWPTRRVADLVARDLADLGGSPGDLPRGPMRILPQPELLATLYVLEGSSLGARVLVKSVAELGLSASHGARHLYAQAGDAASWRSFVALLESAPKAPCHATARAVFDRFADAYKQAIG